MLTSAPASVYVFPADAGMNRNAYVRPGISVCVPRRRGDEPMPCTFEPEPRAPRTRGDEPALQSVIISIRTYSPQNRKWGQAKLRGLYLTTINLAG